MAPASAAPGAQTSLTPGAGGVGRAPGPLLLPGGLCKPVGATGLEGASRRRLLGPGGLGWWGWRMTASTVKLGHRSPKTLSSGDWFSKTPHT